MGITNIEDKKDLILYLSSIKKGEKPQVKPPMSYLFYTYRRSMGISWNDFLQTPTNIVLQDLEYISLDNEILNNK